MDVLPLSAQNGLLAFANIGGAVSEGSAVKRQVERLVRRNSDSFDLASNIKY